VKINCILNNDHYGETEYSYSPITGAKSEVCISITNSRWGMNNEVCMLLEIEKCTISQFGFYGSGITFPKRENRSPIYLFSIEDFSKVIEV